MTGEEKLEFGIVYDLIMENKKVGRFLFAGRRKRINTTNLKVPRESWYLIMGMYGDRGVALKLSRDQFSLEEGRIVTSASRMEFDYLVNSQRKHIEQKLQEARTNGDKNA